MKVFICWSGRRSREFAVILRRWLQTLMPRQITAAISVDIQKGTIWFDELDRALAGARLGIVCLTGEALRSSWIHYEAGILSRALREATRSETEGPHSPQVFPVLFGLESQRLSGPLAAYQSTSASSREDMWRFVQSVARAGGIGSANVREQFDRSWKRLLADFDSVSPAPIQEVFPDIDELFRGKAFDERLDEQLTQNWLDRHDEVRRVHWTLRERLGTVRAECRRFTSDVFNELAAETEAYARDLSLLIGQRFEIDEHGRVAIGQQGIGRACERRRQRVLTLAAQLVDPRQAARFDDAFRFAAVGSTEQRKKLVHREAAELLARPASRRPGGAERRKWLASDWDLDRILFYQMQRDRPLKSFSLLDAVRHAAVEFERVRFRAAEPGLSLMALYYSLDGLRRILRSCPKRTRRGSAKAEAETLVSEVLAFLDRPEPGPNPPIRTALRDIAEGFELTSLVRQASGTAAVDRTRRGRRPRRQADRRA